MLVNKKYIHIGKGVRIEKHAIIGKKPLRKTAAIGLKIGKDSLIMSGAIIYAGSIIGHNAIIAHNAIVREENIIGYNFCLWTKF